MKKKINIKNQHEFHCKERLMHAGVSNNFTLSWSRGILANLFEFFYPPPLKNNLWIAKAHVIQDQLRDEKSIQLQLQKSTRNFAMYMYIKCVFPVSVVRLYHCICIILTQYYLTLHGKGLIKKYHFKSIL